jgi:hypothetical protein
MNICRFCGGIIAPINSTEEDKQDIRLRTDMDICGCDQIIQFVQRGSVFF